MVEKVFALLLKIRSPAILVGTLYAVAFVLLLPFAFSRGQGVLTLAEVVLVAVVAAVAVHVLLNWIYYLVVVVPALMAAIFFTAGLITWLAAPLINFLNLGPEIAGFSMGSLWGTVSELVSRLGQAGMLIGGGLWWLTQKLGRVNYQALVVYIVALIMIGLVMGAIEPSTVVVSLVAWGLIYLRVKGEQDLSQFRIAFRVLASLLVLVSIGNVEVVKGSGLLDTAFRLSDAQAFWGLTVYKWALAGAAWLCIWWPRGLLELFPEQWRQAILHGYGWLVREGSVLMKYEGMHRWEMGDK